jgi:DNA-binding MarR family transcriptional regulator
MTQATRLPFGTALALAQRVLAVPLAAVLSAEAMTMPTWFTLNALGLRGPTSVEVLSTLLATNGLDHPAVLGLLGELTDSGLVEERDRVVSLTADGTARYTHMRDRIETVSTRIFEQFDPIRVETTRSLLQEIAQTDPDQLTLRSVQTG